ncbi:MAG TPA: hypothetical protein VD971_03830 [Phycisphaerales bacterium]|nr:hypothetical protein [Phycisphaerales bacterium]
MEVILSIIFGVLALGAGLYLLIRVNRGFPILSQFHFFLAGFIIFQLTSGALCFAYGRYGEGQGVTDPVTSGFIYLGYVVVFLTIFLIAYHRGWFTFGIYRRIGERFPAPGSVTMMILAAGILGMAAVFRFVLAFVPVFSQLALIIAAALCAAAAATASWAWARHWRNPAFIAGAMAIVAGAVLMMMYQNFGRRDVTSVLLACTWGAFHGYFKHVSFRRAALPLAVVAVMGLTVISAFTNTRSERIKEMGIGEVVGRLFSANIVNGWIDMFSGQDAAAYSMYLIENRPEASPYDPLHSLVYGVTMPVPRQFWDGKPTGLGLTMVPEMGIRFKSSGYNVGPGLMGHIANDIPYIALWLYPLLIAGLLANGDRLIARFPDNPFIVIPLGVPLGEIVAISRGELGLFLFRTVAATISAYFFMWLVARVFIAFGMRYGTMAGEAGHDQDGVEYADAGEAARGYDAGAYERG